MKYILYNTYIYIIYIFFYVFIYLHVSNACVSHSIWKIGGVTPKGGFPKGICYNIGLPAYFSVFPFLLVKHYYSICNDFICPDDVLESPFTGVFCQLCSMQRWNTRSKRNKTTCVFFTDPRRTRGLSSATTYYWYKASGWSHLLVARMDGGSGASRVFLKAQTHHCSMDFTVFKFFVFGIPFASMLSWCFMVYGP